MPEEPVARMGILGYVCATIGLSILVVMGSLMWIAILLAIPKSYMAAKLGVAVILSIGFAAMIGSPTASFLRSFRKLRSMRAIKNLPVSKVKNMPMGLVALQGKALKKEPLTAPVSGSPCASWRIVVVTVPLAGEEGGGILEHRSREPFDLDDGTGIARIEPEGANPDVPYVEQSTFRFARTRLRAMPDSCRRYLEKASIVDYVMSVKEWILPIGAELYVVGSAQPHPKPVSGREASAAVVKKDAATGLLVISTGSPAKAASEVRRSLLLMAFAFAAGASAMVGGGLLLYKFGVFAATH